MPLKIETRFTLSGTPDLIRFFTKTTPLPAGLSAEEFEAKPLSYTLWRENGQRVLLVGLGEVEKLEPDVLRRAAGVGAKYFLNLGTREIALDLTDYAELVNFAVEGVLLAAYKFEDFRPEDKRRKKNLNRLTVLVNENELVRGKLLAQEAEIIARATNLTRSIGNLPPNVLNPATLAEHVVRLTAKQARLKVKISDERQLEKGGFGGILNVGRGSKNKPRLIVIEYAGGAKKEAPIALVGKAITFDSGGISLKPGDRMDEMKWDKMGGLAVLGAILAAAELKLPINLVALIPSAENMPGSDAYRPGDIIPTLDGKTIEVLNTDAEGRIILADAIAHARLDYKPKAIFEFSTLTGACIIAIGGKRAGLFTTVESYRDAFVAAGKITGDLVWPLPVDDEYKEAILSEVAFAKNTGGREAGACTGASFVKLWAEEVPFVHVDIAGPAWITKDYPYLEKGATGFGVRLVLQVLRSLLAP